MKNLIYGISILFLFVSCKTAKEIQKTDPINDPSLFIGNHKAKAMVLGVFHFSNPQLDSYKPKFPFDILEKQRQSELDILLEKIAEYRPTKILLELNRIEMDSLTNESYQSYLNGKFLIDDKNNEVYQIGFKLAKKLNHHRVYCSDADAKWFGVNLDWDKYDAEAYLKSKGQYEKTTRYDYESLYKLQDSLKTIQSLTRMLNMLNNPVGRLKDHQAYLTNILEGAGDNYLGADNVGRWYRRNLRIFSNAYDFTNFNKEERLLLIYGSGHVWLLRQFFMDSPDFEYVEANDYLKD
ncbi:DUF5694 domain-containing protein [Flavobacterium sp. LS1R47]|uniref:DUF5694 domain-containing protein n=1 Tax=Flavobacterium frigoritolerans TaxID=2987686 RepID=A0A9X3C9X5_9FLAO|nr:DUF5694 domain-containing protein [Flavobacterium frigoritolerans]MCV9934272.1 DUF5694 domain-containing protein [Flavobacterium frigoritolerans]